MKTGNFMNSGMRLHTITFLVGKFPKDLLFGGNYLSVNTRSPLLPPSLLIAILDFYSFFMGREEDASYMFSNSSC